eukprot:1389676-Pyramimonas_sp.AAC.1
MAGGRHADAPNGTTTTTTTAGGDGSMGARTCYVRGPNRVWEANLTCSPWELKHDARAPRELRGTPNLARQTSQGALTLHVRAPTEL